MKQAAVVCALVLAATALAGCEESFTSAPTDPVSPSVSPSVSATPVFQPIQPRPTNPAEPWAPRKIKVGERDREYLVSIPNVPMGTEVPLVFVFHGKTSEAQRIMKSTELYKAEAVVVAPQGTKNLEGDGNAWAPSPYVETTPEEEHDLVVGIVEELSREMPIDRDRVYITGFSNGGGLTAHLATHYPEEFAAAALVGAAVRETPEELRTGLPIPLMIIHGAKDTTVPTSGYLTTPPGQSEQTVAAASVVEEEFIKRNGTDKVVATTVPNMTHRWATSEYDTTAEVLKFFGIPLQVP